MDPSPLDRWLPAALVHVVVCEFSDPEAWARLLATSRRWVDVVRLAAAVHPWAGRAREVRDLTIRDEHGGVRGRDVRGGAASGASLAVLHAVAGLASLDAAAVFSQSPSAVVGLARGLGLPSRRPGGYSPTVGRAFLRCPASTWRPWLPLALRFGEGGVEIERVQRHVAPIPPVVEVVAVTPGDMAGLGAIARDLHENGCVGRLTTTACVRSVPRCDVYLVPRKRALAWLDEFLVVERRHRTMSAEETASAAERRFAKLPPRGLKIHDTYTLWAVVVPPAEHDDGARLAPRDAAPTAQIDRLLALSREVARA